jgi:hypothetical protein
MSLFDNVQYTMREALFARFESLNIDERNVRDYVTLSNATAFFGVVEEDKKRLVESTKVFVCTKECMIEIVRDVVAGHKRLNHSDVNKIVAHRMTTSHGFVYTLSYFYYSFWANSSTICWPILEFLTSMHKVLCDQDVDTIYWIEEKERTCFLFSGLKDCEYFLTERRLWEEQDGEFSMKSFLQKLERWGFLIISLYSIDGSFDPEDMYMIAPYRKGPCRSQRREIDVSLLTVSSSLSH